MTYRNSPRKNFRVLLEEPCQCRVRREVVRTIDQGRIRLQDLIHRRRHLAQQFMQALTRLLGVGVVCVRGNGTLGRARRRLGAVGDLRRQDRGRGHQPDPDYGCSRGGESSHIPYYGLRAKR
jgi:hypothetical protein